jgi:hypothetical protein
VLTRVKEEVRVFLVEILLMAHQWFPEVANGTDGVTDVKEAP